MASNTQSPYFSVDLATDSSFPPLNAPIPSEPDPDGDQDFGLGMSSDSDEADGNEEFDTFTARLNLRTNMLSQTQGSPPSFGMNNGEHVEEQVEEKVMSPKTPKVLRDNPPVQDVVNGGTNDVPAVLARPPNEQYTPLIPRPTAIEQETMDSEHTRVVYDTEDDNEDTHGGFKHICSYESDDLDHGKRSAQSDDEYIEKIDDEYKETSEDETDNNHITQGRRGFKHSSHRVPASPRNTRTPKHQSKKKLATFKNIEEDASESDEPASVVERVTETTTTTTTTKKVMRRTPEGTPGKKPSLSRSLNTAIEEAERDAVLGRRSGRVLRTRKRRRNDISRSPMAKNMYTQEAFDPDLTQAVHDAEEDDKFWYEHEQKPKRQKKSKSRKKKSSFRQPTTTSCIATAATRGETVKYDFFSDIVFLLTKVESDTRDEVHRMILRANGQIYDQASFEPEDAKILHSDSSKRVVLVAGEISTTPKYLMALAIGSRIVTVNWIRHCYQKKELILPIEDRAHTLPCGVIDDSVADMIQLQESKVQSQQMPIEDLHVQLDNRLFSGLCIAVEGSQTFKRSWKSILEASGATVRTNSGGSYRNLDYVLAEDAKDAINRKAAQERVPVVIHKFFVQSLIYDDLLDPMSELFLCNRRQWDELYGNGKAEGSLNQHSMDMDIVSVTPPKGRALRFGVEDDISFAHVRTSQVLDKPSFQSDPYRIIGDGTKLYGKVELGNGREILLGDVVQLTDGYFGIVQSLEESRFKKQTVRYIMLCEREHLQDIVPENPPTAAVVERELFLTDDVQTESLDSIVPHVRVVLLKADSAECDKIAHYLANGTVDGNLVDVMSSPTKYPMTTIVKHCSRQVCTMGHSRSVVNLQGRNEITWNLNGYESVLQEVRKAN